MVEGAGGKLPWSTTKVLGLVAFPLLALTVGIGTFWAVGHIEDTLVAEATADLTAAGIDTAGLDIEFDYRDGQASGVLPDGVSPGAVEAAVDHDLLRDFEVSATEAVPVPTEVGDIAVRVELIDDRMVLSGTVLSEAQRESLIGAAGRVVGVGGVDDQLTVSGLQPAVDGADDRVAGLADAVGLLWSTDTATLELTDERLSIAAEVADDRVATELRDLEDSITSVATSIAVETIRSPLQTQIEELQAELDALAAEIRETVVFESESDDLSPEAGVTLDKVVDAMDRHPLPVVEIAGHTDNEGSSSYNVELSQARAAAVESYLADGGVDRERLRSRGAGDSEPIASNDTAEGRAENRRVELTALASF